MAHSRKAKTQKDLFGQLPDEIILEIVEHIMVSRIGFGGNQHQKVKQTITLVSEDSKPLCIYQHNPEAPIMSDFQSFSVVNRRIYNICRPFIWHFLMMPHELSRPISFWNQEILPKHASYVQEFYTDLEHEWFKEPHSLNCLRLADCDENEHHFTLRSSDLNKFKFHKSISHLDFASSSKRCPLPEAVQFEDLDPHIQKSLLDVKQDVVLRNSSGLSPSHLLRFLAQCDNLTMIRLELPPHWHSFPEEIASNLSCNLTSLFSNLRHLQHLQHLEYLGATYSSIPAESIIEPIKHLPLLASLELANISVKEWGRTDCLASSLGTLKNLKKLFLMCVDVIDNSWGRHIAPPQLAKLVIHHYPNVWSSNLPLYISSWAPHLTELELKYDARRYLEPEEILPAFSPRIHRFSLPALTHLTIYRNPACETFHCFTDCPNLCHLTVREPAEAGLSEFSDFIISDVFPNLKKLVMPMKYRNLPPRPELDSKLIPLEAFCKVKGIEFDVTRDFVSRFSAGFAA